GGIVGAAVGYAVARRRRWPDGDVALYLDARLASSEAITTAVELDAARTVQGSADAVLSRAAAALAGASPAAARPAVLRRSHPARGSRHPPRAPAACPPARPRRPAWRVEGPAPRRPRPREDHQAGGARRARRGAARAPQEARRRRAQAARKAPRRRGEARSAG